MDQTKIIAGELIKSYFEGGNAQNIASHIALKQMLEAIITAAREISPSSQEV